MVNAGGNHLVQIIPQVISPPPPQVQQQRTQLIQQPHQQVTMQSQNQYVPISQATAISAAGNASKQNKLPQQILPKPSGAATVNSFVATSTSSSGRSVISPPKNSVHGTLHVGGGHQQPVQQQTVSIPVQQSQQAQSTQQTQPIITTATTHPPPQASPIILPTGNLNHPLLLNQMPMILQQNAPQGVQLILRPPTPQLAAPSLVIHNSRPQIHQTQQQPQQLLRIVNANGQMQLATATPTFIVSSQSNLIQQNLQGIKAQANNTLNSLQGLTSQTPQQLAAAISSQLIGRSMAQLQNLQLNGNLAQIQMSNGLNGQFISQLPAQFQQSVAGFNQFNQLNSTSFQPTAFQSPPPSGQNSNDMVVAGTNIQFTTQQPSINVSVAQQSIPSSQLIAVQSQSTQMLPTTLSTTSEPMRNPTPITILPNNTVIVPDAAKAMLSSQMSQQVMPIQAPANVVEASQQQIIHMQNTTTTLTNSAPAANQKAAKKPKKPKAKKSATAGLAAAAMISNPHTNQTIVQSTKTPSIQSKNSAPQSQVRLSPRETLSTM